MHSSSPSRFVSVVDVWRISCSVGLGREPILQRNLQRKCSHGRQWHDGAKKLLRVHAKVERKHEKTASPARALVSLGGPS
jgi:hypothetical protein